MAVFLNREWIKETKVYGRDGEAFLMIGQSNMCGRGVIGSVPPIEPKNQMFMLRNGRWQPMSEPINPDRKVFVDAEDEFRSGICLAASFAEEYVKNSERHIGLIPCADGGTNLKQWQPGEVLFDHAVLQTRLAKRSSVLHGILWHQGESDSKEMEDVRAYYNRFFYMLDNLLEEVGANCNTPVIVGEITTKLLSRWPYADKINVELHRIAQSRPNIAIAKADDLDIGPDGVHFTGQAYRILGRRYYQAYLSVLERMKQ